MMTCVIKITMKVSINSTKMSLGPFRRQRALLLQKLYLKYKRHNPFLKMCMSSFPNPPSFFFLLQTPTVTSFQIFPLLRSPPHHHHHLYSPLYSAVVASTSFILTAGFPPPPFMPSPHHICSSPWTFPFCRS